MGHNIFHVSLFSGVRCSRKCIPLSLRKVEDFAAFHTASLIIREVNCIITARGADLLLFGLCFSPNLWTESIATENLSCPSGYVCSHMRMISSLMFSFSFSESHLVYVSNPAKRDLHVSIRCSPSFPFTSFDKFYNLFQTLNFHSISTHQLLQRIRVLVDQWWNRQ